MDGARGETSVRDRLLSAADELFYAQGVHSVGIDRVLERAGVAKASLYSTFGSKEALVSAYLERRAAARQERIREHIARFSEPDRRILAVFEVLAEVVAEPSFRGCAFVNASAEEPEGETKVRVVCRSSRSWIRQLFSELSRELGAVDPERLSRALALLYDGVLVGASMERDPRTADDARAMVELLLATTARRGRAARGAKVTSRKGSR